MTDAFPDPRQLLKKYGFAAKKSWGQNFLISERVYRAIVDATVREPHDWIVEIGAGLGTLTMRLAERAPEGRIIAVEREPDMQSVLRAELGHLDNVEVHNKDALRYDFGDIARWRGAPIAVCGNLPYQIASQLIFLLLEQREHVTHAVLMLQKEMADRLLAPPGNKTYGAFTVLLSAFAEIRAVVKAPASAFSPAPKADSAVVQLKFLDKPRAGLTELGSFSDVVHAAFAQRRKTLRNSLQSRFDAEAAAAALSRAGIDGGRRAETLSVEEFADLTAAFQPSRAN